MLALLAIFKYKIVELFIKLQILNESWNKFFNQNYMIQIYYLLSFRICNFMNNSTILYLKIASNASIYLTFFKIQNLNQTRPKIKNWFRIIGLIL